jgi:hypothetical protein
MPLVLDCASTILKPIISDFHYRMLTLPCGLAAAALLPVGLLEAVFGLGNPRYGLLMLGMGFLASFGVCFMIC